jgi:predicted nucleic acid-binding protein
VARHLILDAEPLNALARPRRNRTAARRAHAVAEAARRNDATVVVPSAVLIELYRGTAADAAVDRVVGSLWVVTTGRRIARHAGALLARARLDSADAIDAVVVATAVRLGGGVILTGDPDDIGRLAAPYPNVAVYPL